MLNSANLITLPYTPDLTRAGIAYACQSLAFTYNRMGGSRHHRLRRIVAGKAVELGFRHYLEAQAVPHDHLGSTPFTDPDQYDVALHGLYCDVKSFMFFEKDRIRQLRRDPDHLLQASALVPADQMASSHLSETDVYVFAFLTALITSNQAELERALAAGQPVFMIHALPPSWSNPLDWKTFAPLSLSWSDAETVQVEIGGQGSDRAFLTEQVTLDPQRRMQARKDFHSLAYLHPNRQTRGQLRLVSTTQRKSHLVSPSDWSNIWVYGMEIILAGYMPRGEFRHRAHLLPAGSQVLQYPRTRTANYALPVADLYPLKDLL